ncbi:MAG: CehA/McbA family metallohydrolase [Deltaproteobacteria bacterium]|nr:CehA/McbA family metallohydrolase [Deltaproteobacteria bacterium]
MTRMLLLLVVAVGMGSGCGGSSAVPAADRARAFRISQESELIGGPKAMGRVGDFMLINTKVRFVIAAAGRTRAWFPVGGGIIDADRVRDGAGEDRLQEMTTRLGAIRVLYAETVEVANDGADGKAAVVRVTGYDVGVPILQDVAQLPKSNVQATTEYRLEPYAESLEMTTTITEQAGKDEAVLVGDMVVLGDFVTAYVPPYGTDSSKFGFASNARFWATFGGDVSYAYLTPGRGVGLLAPTEEVLGIGIQTVALPANGTATFTRYLVVGDGDVASMLPEVWRREGGDPAMLGTVTGKVTEQGTGAAVAGALVEFSNSAGSYAIAVSQADGTYRAPLEPGSYTYALSAERREGVSTGGLHVTAAVAPPAQDLQTTATGSFAVQVDDPAGAPTPARLRITSPDTGASYRYLSADGRGGGALPPGAYRAVVSRGYEWEMAQVDFTITAGEATTIAATIERVVDTTGFVAIDSHTHTAVSVDASLDPRERVAQALADGVELVITTDHDLLFDLAPVAEGLGLSGGFATAVGAEISPEKGHINGYPLTGGPKNDTDGYWPVKWWSEDAKGDFVELRWPADIFARMRDQLDARVVQLNHPRSASIGIFYWVDYSPTLGMASMDPARFDMNWDVMEICNSGCDPAADSEDSTALLDYYSFLNQGFLRGAVGVSDAHGSSEFLGRARTMVEVPDDDPAHLDLGAVWDSLKAGRAVVLDGAFVTATVLDDSSAAVGMGGLARVSGVDVTLHVRVQAPSWIPTGHIHVVRNGVEVKTVTIPPGGAPKPVVRFDEDIVLAAPAADAFYVVIVDGDPGMDPVMPGTRPRSVTNAIFVDRDGNGAFDAAGL